MIVIEDLPTQYAAENQHHEREGTAALEIVASMEDEVAFDRLKADTVPSLDAEMPSDHDILCGRGRALENHPGNKVFREIVRHPAPRYRDPTTSCKSKSAIGKMIYAQTCSDNMDFVKKVNGSWIKLCEKEVKLKIGHALRDSRPQEKRPPTMS
jgi:hypothetical protein